MAAFPESRLALLRQDTKLRFQGCLVLLH